MLTIEQINSATDFKNLSREDLIEFLFKHLDRFGDSKEAIGKSIDYVFSGQEGKGGFILTGYLNNQLVGVVIMNRTGMDGYIPENILVYIAVDAAKRGNGIGKQLMEAAIDRSQGDIALHVEYDNPAKRLYERIGFGSKYAEMRFYKK
ncbi:MAG TPA: GNAT family N-acetyltransferase [Tenuifilaceae bacterium]|nr:GNAT family N-acetyltransferase [Tenuifilaceae bacterium]HQB77052.1 GNAT family N-acetyltransferase [Tenuifilaceae bacterium]